jgi:hypothetical protein
MKNTDSGSVGPVLKKHRVDWLSPRAEDDAMSFLHAVSSIYSNKGEYSRHLNSLVEKGSYRDVVEFSVPVDAELEDFRGARQIQGLFSKNPWVDLGYNPLLEGVKAFIKAEQKCYMTNVILEASPRLNGRVSNVFHIAARKIERILGDVPCLSSLKFRYGPGANTSIKMAQASLSGKLSATLACSEDMLPTVGQLLSEVPLLVELWCEKNSTMLPYIRYDEARECDVVNQRLTVQVHDGKLVFVPKSAKTHRPIIVEPILNGFFQLGVGSYLKDRLALYSLDLRDQELNRKLARKGSEDGSLSTIDLSSASDTLSWGLVAELLPPDWLSFLSQFRTGTFSYEGSAYSLEKFSSMGNGFTFELESLIFYALAFGCVHAVGGDVSNIGVFGDDIIVPANATSLLFEVLDHAGFWVNPQKSYWSGPFRESCGADWLKGCDVRPFFVKEEVSDKFLYIFHNWALRRGEYQLAKLCEDWTWSDLRLYGPDGFGDGHLLGSHRLYQKRKDLRNGYCGGYFDTYQLRPRSLRKPRVGDWLIPSYSSYTRSGSESVTDPYRIRGSFGYVRRSIYSLTTNIFS